jgi:hypothetical protein
LKPPQEMPPAAVMEHRWRPPSASARVEPPPASRPNTQSPGAQGVAAAAARTGTERLSVPAAAPRAISISGNRALHVAALSAPGLTLAAKPGAAATPTVTAEAAAPVGAESTTRMPDTPQVTLASPVADSTTRAQQASAGAAGGLVGGRA